MSAVLGAATQVMEITTPTLGANKLLALRVDGREALSRMSEYTIDCVGNASVLTGRVKVDLHGMLGTRINVSIDVAGNKRYIDGYVIRALRGERHGRFDRYNLVLRPWLWFATRTKTSRVFQDKTVKEIISAVLDTYSSDYDWDLQGELPKLEYCVQYDETDFDFVSRLMEEFGVYYFFKHSDSDHTLVLVDAMNKHPKRASSGPLTWSNKLDGNSRLTGWHTLEEVRSTKAVVRDYDYLASGTEIEAKDSGSQSATTAVLGEAEIYEFPARAVQNQVAAKSKSAAKAADDVAKRIVEAAQSMQKLHSGECNAHDMTAGVTFKLTNAPRSEEDAEYLIVACEFSAEYGDQEAITDLKNIKQRRDGFIGNIQAIHATKGLFRPERNTPRPRMHGPQIATVVGASSNEIETDENGRIKIQFPWDREGEKDQNSSCWVRVAQPWAGEKMGLWMLPRIGHEVVVSFIGGDPDRPIVTGSVHNDANPPPYKLPAHADVST
ncbi:MAG: type VI secretion system tip protein VgrG, partial [Rubrivivax sp.]